MPLAGAMVALPEPAEDMIAAGSVRRRFRVRHGRRGAWVQGAAK